MDKRQGILLAFLGIVLAGGLAFWWLTQAPEEPIEVQPLPAPAPVVAPSVPAPVAIPSTVTQESDPVALSEEEIDKINHEVSELASRAADLESQASDSDTLLAMKDKEIQALEAQLKKPAAKTEVKVP